MVIRAFALFSFLFGTVLLGSALDEKIIAIVGTDTFKKNRAFLDSLFEDNAHFVTQGRINVINVVETLQDNGLLDTSFPSPRRYTIAFETNGLPTFFIKIMSDTMRSMGYYRYFTKESVLNNSSFVWTIEMFAEYAANPVLMERELNKRGCSIIDLEQTSNKNWKYTIDMSAAHLNVTKLMSNERYTFNKVDEEYWFNITDIRKLKVVSSSGNNWYPNVSIYDRSLRLLKVYKRDERTNAINITLPKDATYLKVLDLYSAKNMKNGLQIVSYGSR